MTDEASLPTYALDDGVAVITLDDGKANAMSSDVIVRLDELLDQAFTDQARALVIVGRPGKFSAGFNLAEMTESDESMRALVVRGGRWLLRLYGYGLPTVAACTGHALAGGALTLLACDVRIGAEGDAKIGLNEVAIGMPLPKFAVEMARDRLTKAAFGDATLGGKVFDPAGALAAGYLDQVVPESEVVATAMAEARRLSQLRTGAYGRTKANTRQAMIDEQVDEIISDMATVSGPQV
jgi:enoyl-CoA hydratase